MTDAPETVSDEPAPADGWEWMFLEVMGHRSHWGRAREEDRFGVKMLRIDVPRIVTGARAGDGQAERSPRIDWVTHYYSGASIFSYTLTDEASVMARNTPYEPMRARLAAPEHDDDDFDCDDEEQPVC